MFSDKRGILSAVGAYLLWGVLPVYWKALHAVPALQVLAHRTVWSFVFLAGLVLLRREGPALRASAGTVRILLGYAAAACLLATNWLTYIWAVNADRIVETSLGYYINPLVSVLLGVVFLRERLRPVQWLAVALAAAGVVYLTAQHGKLPWIALVLPFSFGLYGLAKKLAPLGALHGLTVETGLSLAPGLGYLLFVERQGTGAFGHATVETSLLLALAGLVTALPLLLFAHAAQRINLSTLGILQYIAPTCGLIVGVRLYHEPFTIPLFIGFAVIWVALIVYWGEGALRLRRLRRLETARPAPAQDSPLAR
jgi:chloramphenicol-sensitive protein RarD